MPQLNDIDIKQAGARGYAIFFRSSTERHQSLLTCLVAHKRLHESTYAHDYDLDQILEFERLAQAVKVVSPAVHGLLQCTTESIVPMNTSTWTTEDEKMLRVYLSISKRQLTIHDLGWSEKFAAKIRSQLAGLEEEWDAPGMDAYDDL